MAAPAFRSAGEGPTGTTTSTTVPKPAGTTEGDVLYALLVNGGAMTAPPTVPSGWVLTEGLTMNTGWAGVYEHVAGASEPADYTWSGFTDSCAGTMVAISGADTTTPTHQASATYNFDDSTPTGTGVTTTATDCLIVGGVGIGDNTGITDTSWACATDPTTLTERAEVPSTGGNDTTSALATGPQTAAGPTGDLSMTLAGSRNAVVFVVAVQPPQGDSGPATADATDTLVLADAANCTATSARSAVDALTSADAATRATSAGRTAADALAFAEGASAVVTRARTATDVLALADTAARAVALARAGDDRQFPGDGSNADVLHVTDTVARTGAAARAAADQVTLADAAAATSGQTVAASDALALTDAAARAAIAQRATNDLLHLGDDAAGASGQTASAADVLALADSAGRVLALAGAAVDTLVLADAPVRTVAAVRAVTDVLTLADTATTGDAAARVGRGTPTLTSYPAADLVDRSDAAVTSYGSEVTLR